MGSLQHFSRDTLNAAAREITAYFTYAELIAACETGYVPSITPYTRESDGPAIGSTRGSFAGSILVAALRMDGQRVFTGL